MNQFELYCVLFRVLDHVWDQSHDPELGAYLSGANPFLFTDDGSAVPSVYQQFCRIVDRPVAVADSYREAGRYIASLHNAAAEKAFSETDEAKWMEFVSGAVR